VTKRVDRRLGRTNVREPLMQPKLKYEVEFWVDAFVSYPGCLETISMSLTS